MTTLPGGRLPRPRPWQRNLALGILGVTIVVGWTANAVFATLVDRHPLVGACKLQLLRVHACN